MSRVALVISDVDGTLVTSEKTLTERSRAAVALLHQHGIGFSVVSSRPPFGMRMLIEPLGLRLPLAGFNGAALFTPELAILDQQRLGRAAARQAVDLLRGLGLDIWLFTAERWLLSNPRGPYVEREKRTVLAEPMVVETFEDHLDGAGKIVAVSDDFDRLAACEEEVREALSGKANVARSQRYYLDVTAPGIDKGVAVAKLRARLGVPREAVVTLGDMENDIPMFAESGFSIAMGNAGAEVKRAAHAETLPNDEDGFAAAVERLILPRAGAASAGR